MQLLLWIVIAVVGVALVVGLVRLLHRFAIQLEEAGYLYYREEPRGAGGSVLGELDKLVRPSIEHTIAVEDTVVESDEIDGD